MNRQTLAILFSIVWTLSGAFPAIADPSQPVTQVKQETPTPASGTSAQPGRPPSPKAAPKPVAAPKPAAERKVTSNCTYTVGGGLRILIGGARQETLQLLSSDETKCPVDFQTRRLDAIAVPGFQAPMPAVALDDSGGVQLLGVPSTLTDQSTVALTLQGAGTVLGTVSITVGKITVDDSLSVRYKTEAADTQQSGKSFSSGGLGTAVVGPRITNTAHLVFPPGVPANTALPSALIWRLASSTWGDDVIFHDCAWGGPDESSPIASAQTSACNLKQVERITFTVVDQSATPLSVDLLLYTPGAEPLLFIRVPIASSAQYETIPLSFVGATALHCNGWKPDVGTGGTIAITREDADLNRCSLSIDYNKTVFGDSKKHFEDYGPQWLSVTVHKDGTDTAKDGHQVWDATPAPKVAVSREKLTKQLICESFDRALATAPAARADAQIVAFRAESAKVCEAGQKPGEELPTPDQESQGIVVPMPAVDTTGEGFYLVYVTLYTDKSFTYRDGTSAKTVVTGTFSARLKLRGAFAWKSSQRTFVTVPVGTAIRFPASSVDLKSSSSPTAYEPVALTTGLLLGIEQWDYQVGRNTWPVPLRALVGFNLFDISSANSSFAPTFVLGGSATFPVIDAPANAQLGSSLAFGAFWEVDLREPSPLQHGGHILITLGFNFLSLGSPSN